MRRLNRTSFVLLYFASFAFSGLCLVFVVSVCHLSSVLYFAACTDVNGTVSLNVRYLASVNWFHEFLY